MDCSAIRRLTCALCALALPVAHAQGRSPTLGQLYHTAWTVRDGAPPSIRALAQSADGYLWLGTSAGLYRFDGVRFEAFEPATGLSLPSRSVNALLALPDGSLWIGYAYGGLSILAGGRLTHYGEPEGFPPGVVTALARDSSGTVWAATNAGIAELIAGRWHRAGPESGFPGGMTADLMVDRRGTLWASAQAGVYIRTTGSRQFLLRAPSLDGFSGGAGAAREAPDGSVWGASVQHGLVALSDSAGNTPPTAFASRDSSTLGLIVDRQGYAWTYGMYPHLIRFPVTEHSLRVAASGSTGRDSRRFSRELGMSGITPTAILEDREGNIWVGTEAGLDRFRVTKLTPVEWPRALVFPAVAAGDDGRVWTGSLQWPLVSVGDSVVEHDGVPAGITCAYRDFSGDVWLGGYAGLWRGRAGKLVRVSVPPVAVGADVQAIAYDRAGTLWLSVRGQRGNGVFRRRGETWEAFDAPQGLGGLTARVITADSAGRTWLGYTGNRIAIVDSSSTRLLTASDGLHVGIVTAIRVHGEHVWIGGESGVMLLHGTRPQSLVVAGGSLSNVTGIVETAEGDLWLNGDGGVTRVPAAELQRATRDALYAVRAERFDYRDGIDGPAPQFRPFPTAIEGSDGRLWFSTENGLSWVNPHRIRRNTLPPPVHIAWLKAGDVRYQGVGRVTLPARTTELEIGYTALSLGIPDRVRFRYQLAGNDTGWQYVATRREAFYTNLAPGTYRFRVMGSNDDGVWNESSDTLEVIIPPTFVQTKAFLAMCFLGALVAVWLLTQWRHRQTLRTVSARFDATLAERTRIAQELHDTLLQGFTGISLQLYSVRRLLETHPDDAGGALSRAIEDTDAALRDAREMVWDLRCPELDQHDLPEALEVAARAAIAKAPIALHVTIGGHRHPVPRSLAVAAFRIGREAVFNVLRHAHAQNVSIALDYTPRWLTITISDDGRGLEASEAASARNNGHWGIVGIRERAESVGGTLTIEATPGTGTRVSAALPMLSLGEASAAQSSS